jgi:hypothetical protein
MSWLDKAKNTIDWGRRGQFVIQVAILLLTAAWWKSTIQVVRLTAIPAGWRAPIYLSTSALVLLLLSSVDVWWSNRKPSPDKSREVLEEVMRAGVSSALYDYMGARARDLIRDIETLWHHWNNAGEKLVHPLTATIDKVQDWSDYEKASKLVDERRDFLVLYSHHVMVVRLMLPEFNSRTMDDGYPSSKEYVQARTDLVTHAEELESLSEIAWEKYGRPLRR